LAPADLQVELGYPAGLARPPGPAGTAACRIVILVPQVQQTPAGDRPCDLQMTHLKPLIYVCTYVVNTAVAHFHKNGRGAGGGKTMNRNEKLKKLHDNKSDVIHKL
jgi:hypothetical protein